MLWSKPGSRYGDARQDPYIEGRRYCVMSQAYFTLNQRAATLIVAVLAIAGMLSFAAAALSILENGTAAALSPHALSPSLV
jgi:hypothetical protein